MGRRACTEPQCLYIGTLYLYLYLYSPYWPYGLYRASVPVQWYNFTLTYTSTPPMGRRACKEPQCLYNGTLYLYLYLYSLYGPYGLYRASVPVQWYNFTFTYTSTPPIGRRACIEPQFLYNGTLYLYLYLYSPYGPYCLYRASVPVQWYNFTFTYTSTPPMGRTACTEPQCLYNGTTLPLPVRNMCISYYLTKESSKFI